MQGPRIEEKERRKMKKVSYWQAIDGILFEDEGDCQKYEIGLIEQKYGISYYGHKSDTQVSFNEAWVVLMPREMEHEDYNMIRDWYNWTIPNEIGTYIWNDEDAEWIRE
jgi:hypothetical protein